MSMSRYRSVMSITAKFPYRRNPRTDKAIPLSFLQKLSFANPDGSILETLEYEEVSFSPKDTLAALSSKFYGEPTYWWLIALVNNIASEHEISVGQTLVILSPPEALSAAFGV